MKGKFSYFLPPIWNTSPDSPLSLGEVWRFISGTETLDVFRKGKDGDSYPIGSLQDVTRQVRSLPPEVYNNKQKGKVIYLPLCTFGGTFSKRGGDGLLESSGYLHLDIDHISKLPGVSLEELKDRISKDREIGVRLVFTSPSGDGLKIVCETSGEVTDPESYKREFETLQYFVSKKYSLPIGEVGLDKGISDICRGCLLCYDPEAILQTWTDTFDPAQHPLPPEEISPRPKRERGTDSVSVWDWESFEDSRLVPAIFDRIPEIFPEMRFKWRGREWQSPYKLDGSPAKDPRGDKTYISQTLPGFISEHGGESLPVIGYYASKNNLSRTEAVRELSRICGLEEEDLELRRKYARMKEKENDMRNTSTGGQTASPTPPQTPEERFKEYLQIPDLQTEISRKKEGIKTGYFFKNSRGKGAELVLSPGLTLICGRSSHGKTRLLQNLALRIVEEISPEEDGSVLFFAFEEDYPEVILQFANLHSNIPQLSKYGTENLEVLRDYFQTGELKKATENKRTEALPRLKEFKEIQTSGRLRVYYSPDLKVKGDRPLRPEDTPPADLAGVISFLSSKMKVKAVFLDYVQAIYKEDYRRERREELREICKELNTLSKELDIPFVLSAQLNRETPSPTAMSGDNIAESADITRYADTILCLWNSAFINDVKDKDKYLESKDYSLLKERGFVLGEEGKLYCILTKNRGSIPFVDAVLDFVGETGKIPVNDDLPPDTAPEEIQGELEYSQA